MLSLFKSNCINLAKFFRLFYTKNLLFLFYTTTLPKHPHQYSHMGENLEVEASRSGQHQGRSNGSNGGKSDRFGLILSWVFLWFGLIFCWFWVNFVVDYQLLKWVAVVVVGWCWVSGWVFLLLFFYSSFARLLCPLGCCVSFVELLCLLGKRENMNGEREKNNKILLYTITVASV